MKASTTSRSLMHQLLMQSSKTIKLSNLKTIELKSDQQPYIYFLFADNQKDLQTFVNKRLEELQKDGTLAKLAEKFLGNKDYIPTKDALKVPSKK